ncbi:MAG: amidohydrolase [Chthoniobacterales bacterium]|nr:amidohydrolase [Chthoniobacterales bacterium]
MRHLLIFAGLVVPALAQSLHAEPKTARRQPVIDMHMHVYAADERWKLRIPNPATNEPMTATDEQAHMKTTMAQMDRYNVVKAMISGNETDYDAQLRWKETAPERFLVWYGFDDPSKADLDFIRKEAQAGRLKGIGEIGPQYEGIAPNDPVLEPIYALAEELDLPLAIHIGLGPPGAAYIGSPKYRMAMSDPLLLEEVLVRHPKLRLYVMHAGWPMIDRMIGLLYAHPQVYVDVAVINWTQPRKEFHAYLRRLVEAGYGKRIMFGSDQMVWPEAIGMAVEAIEAADFLTREQKADIFYNNAARFLRLPDAPK